MESEEEQALRRSCQGDLEAFNLLVEAYQRQVYNLCLRMLASPAAAEDATQETFLSAFRSIRRFRGGSFRAWILRIAANACYDELRRRRHPTVSLDRPFQEAERAREIPQPGEPLEERMEQMELARTLQEALLSLPQDQRLAVILCDVQGLDYQEIAKVMGSSLGTVKSRISRGRARLRQRLLEKRELLPTRFRPS